MQFDTEAADIAASKVIVAERELYYCPFDPHLAQMELGPDGYIYGEQLGGQNCMHRIKYPERAGAACKLQQHYYQLEFPFANLSHFPNFRLGPVDGSSCDTLGLDNHPLAGWRYDRAGGAVVDFTSVSWYEPDTWLWDFGDGTQSSERNPVHEFPGPGAYEVCLTVSNEYGSDTKCKTVWVVSTGVAASPAGQAPVRVWPNPTGGILQVEGAEQLAGTVEIFDLYGRLVHQEALPARELDLSGLADGLYFIRLLDDRGQTLGSGKISLVKR